MSIRSCFGRAFVLGSICALFGQGLFGAVTDGSIKSPWPYTALSSAASGNLIGSPVIGADGTIYFGIEVSSSAGRLIALNPNGTLKWLYLTVEWIDSTPALSRDGGTLVFGCWDGKVYALYAQTGDLKWTFSTNGFISGSPAIGPDGTITIGSGDGALYALNPANGACKWIFPVGDWIESSPAVGPDGTVYFGSTDDTLYAVGSDGLEKWRYAADDDIVGSPALAADGSVVFGSRDGYLYSLNSSGVLRWKFDAGASIESTPAIGQNGSITFCTTGGRIISLRSDGTERWRYPNAGQAALLGIYSSPALRADGSVVVGTSNSSVIALSPSGALLWSTTVGDYVDSSPAIASDGTIYVGCTDKKLYAFNGTQGPAYSDWPQFRHDSQGWAWQPLGLVAGSTGGLGRLFARGATGSGIPPLTLDFQLSGSGSRNLLLRGAGPALANSGVTLPLADPMLTFSAGLTGTIIASNNDWGEASNAATISTVSTALGAIPFASGSKDAAIYAPQPASLYTLRSGTNTLAAGITMAEVFDNGGDAGARLEYALAGAQVGTGEQQVHAGFTVSGGNRSLLIRGLGPVIGGTSGFLADPRLVLYATSDGNTRAIAENDDWSSATNASALQTAAQDYGAVDLASGSKDAALLVTLPEGQYHAVLSGASDGMGYGMIETLEVSKRSTGSKLFGIASRSPVGTGDGVHIAGFVVTGSAPKTVLVRAAGPALVSAGIAGYLADPRLELRHMLTQELIASNDDWASDAANEAAVRVASNRLSSFDWPSNSKDAALVVTLNPGPYSAVVSGADGSTGVVVVEVYESDTTPNASLLYGIATRSLVGTGSNAQFAGFNISGSVPKKVLLRAIGPGLEGAGISGLLADPWVEVHDFQQTGGPVIAVNDNWASDPANAMRVEAASKKLGPFTWSHTSKDAALVLTLNPGMYSAVIRGVGDTTGIAMIEVYDAD